MKVLHLNIKSVRPVLNIGFGYWKDVYTVAETGCDGYIRCIMLPFVLIRLSTLSCVTQGSDSEKFSNHL